MTTMTKMMLALSIAAAAAACVPQPEPTTFVLTNDGEAPVYHDLGWLTLEIDGEPAMLNEPGCMRKCGSLAGQIMCPAAEVYPTVIELQPGDETVREWDGTYYEVSQDRSCYRERRRGGEFAVRFCYGHEYEVFEGEDPEPSGRTIPGAWLTDSACEIQPFERGETVELLAE